MTQATSDSKMPGSSNSDATSESGSSSTTESTNGEGPQSLTIGQAIKALRMRAGIDQYSMARLCGLSRGCIGNIEIDYRHPSPQTIARISEGLQLDPWLERHLLTAAGYTTPHQQQLAAIAMKRILEVSLRNSEIHPATSSEPSREG